MPVLHNIKLLATCPYNQQQDDIGIINDAALVWLENKIIWVGSEKNLPRDYVDFSKIDAQQSVVIPGLVDCHTHLAFGGSRAHEFVLRAKGETYLNIPKAGGGIAFTVHTTRQATKEELVTKAHGFLTDIATLGVTTLECKTGYGLTFQDELKLLEVYDELKSLTPITLVTTLLAAHIVPEEFKSDRAAYIRMICDELIPEVAKRKLAQFCDVFVETLAFSVAEAEVIFATAKTHGLIPKLHADQLTDTHSGALAAHVGAASADHLEYTNDLGIKAMARAEVVAVSLPIASTYLRQAAMDARKFIKAGVKVAIATDFNPGSAPCYDMHLAMTLGCINNYLTPHEALKASTSFAARALRLEQSHGSLGPGYAADFVLLNPIDINHWLYHFRRNNVRAVYKSGERICPAD